MDAINDSWLLWLANKPAHHAWCGACLVLEHRFGMPSDIPHRDREVLLSEETGSDVLLYSRHVAP